MTREGYHVWKENLRREFLQVKFRSGEETQAPCEEPPGGINLLDKEILQDLGSSVGGIFVRDIDLNELLTFPNHCGTSSEGQHSNMIGKYNIQKITAPGRRYLQHVQPSGSSLLIPDPHGYGTNRTSPGANANGRPLL